MCSRTRLSPICAPSLECSTRIRTRRSSRPSPLTKLREREASLCRLRRRPAGSRPRRLCSRPVCVVRLARARKVSVVYASSRRALSRKPRMTLVTNSSSTSFWGKTSRSWLGFAWRRIGALPESPRRRITNNEPCCASMAVSAITTTPFDCTQRPRGAKIKC